MPTSARRIAALCVIGRVDLGIDPYGHLPLKGKARVVRRPPWLAPEGRAGMARSGMTERGKKHTPGERVLLYVPARGDFS